MNIIQNYLNKYKYLQVLLAVFFICIYIYRIYQQTYDRGYKAGYNAAETVINDKYTKIIETKLKEQKERLEKNFEIILDNEKAKKKTEIVFKDRVKIITEVIKENEQKNINCKMSDNTFETINKMTRKVQ